MWSTSDARHTHTASQMFLDPWSLTRRFLAANIATVLQLSVFLPCLRNLFEESSVPKRLPLRFRKVLDSTRLAQASKNIFGLLLQAQKSICSFVWAILPVVRRGMWSPLFHPPPEHPEFEARLRCVLKLYSFDKFARVSGRSCAETL